MTPVTGKTNRQVAVLVRFLELTLEIKGTVETQTASQRSPVWTVDPLTPRDPEHTTATADPQLRRLENVLQWLTGEFSLLQRQAPIAVGTSLTPSQSQIATELPLDLKRQLQGQKTLVSGQLQPFQPCGELEFGTHPTAPSLDGDAPSVGKHKLQRGIGTMFIQADAGPAGCRQAEPCRSDPDPGGIAEAHPEIEPGGVALLREGAWHPVRTLVVATQIEMGSADAHAEHRPQPLQAEQGIEADGDALDFRTRLIAGA